MKWDTSELNTLAVDLHVVAEEAAPAVKAVVVKGALNVKTQWRSNALGSAGKHAKAYPYSVGYDIDPDGMGAEIGPDKAKRQGPLGNLLEFGSVQNPPHNDGGKALEKEAPNFVRYLSDATGLALRRLG